MMRHHHCLLFSLTEIGRTRRALLCFCSARMQSLQMANGQSSKMVEGKRAKPIKLNMSDAEGKECVWTKQSKTSWANYAILLLPATSFALGWWQWERHKWKTALIQRMKDAMKMPAVEFPVDNLATIDEMEFRKVRLRGVFLYDRQLFIRWRGRFDPEADQSGMPGTATNFGLYVVTPMRLDGTGLVITVNRGWIPPENVELEKARALARPVSELKELCGCVRMPEKGTIFQRNEPKKGVWAFKDLKRMGQMCGTLPIMIDADFDSTKTGGPIGGQTNVILRNEHFKYMVQWFGLTVMVLGMWSLQFLS